MTTSPITPIARQAFSHFAAEALACEEWFGVVPDMVRPLPRMIWSQTRKDGGPPDWLRGKPRVERFPRFNAHTDGRRIAVPGIDLPELARRVRWIVENQSGDWRLISQHGSRSTIGHAFRAIIFAKDRDAVHYTLRFGRSCLTTV